MLELTRELIEHYFRAANVHYERTKLFALIEREGIEDAALMYVNAEGLFRLGLCAAAEDALTRSKAYMVRGDTLLGLSKSADGYRLLAEVGIDPKAWEAARKQ